MQDEMPCDGSPGRSCCGRRAVGTSQAGGSWGWGVLRDEDGPARWEGKVPVVKP